MINDYFTMKNSIGHLMSASTGFFLIPMEIEGISNGIRNKMRFRMSIFNLIYFLFAIEFNVFLFSSSNYLFSLIKLKWLPNQTREFIFLLASSSIWVLVIRFDLIMDQINSKLSLFKIFYYSVNNLQSKHKLTDANCNRLVIFSRIFQIIILDVGMPIALILDFIIICFIAILTQRFIWILQSIILIPGMLIGGMTVSLWMCIVFAIFMYYKLRFDQINQQIQSIIPNGKVINKRREKSLMKAINEHNLT